MKIIVWLLTSILFPSLCWGADVWVTDSSDWRPMDPAQLAAIAKQANRGGGRLVDGSTAVSGKGGANLMAAPIKPRVDKLSADNFINSFVQGVERTGPKATGREPVKIGPLRGTSVRFQTEMHGQKFSMVSYLVFSNREGYVTTCYGPGEMAQIAPLAQSYMSRIQFGATIAPGSIDSIAIDSIPGLLGNLAGYAIVALGIVAFVVFMTKINTGKRRVTPPPLPPT